MQANITWRVVRAVEGAALEMLCSPQREPRVQIPNSPPNIATSPEVANKKEHFCSAPFLFYSLCSLLRRYELVHRATVTLAGSLFRRVAPYKSLTLRQERLYYYKTKVISFIFH